MKHPEHVKLFQGGIIIKRKQLVICLFTILATSLSSISSFSADIPMMTKEQLKEMLGNPDYVIFDVRLGSDYFSSDLKVKGAVRPDMSVYVWHTALRYPKGKTFVFYCASSNDERSVSNLKTLLEAGHEGYTKGYVLKGGFEEWLKAGYPTEKK